MAMSIPESHAAVKVSWLRKARQEANEAIRVWAEAAGSNVHFADVAKLVPFDEAAVRRGLWEPDGLHMSPDGYEAFGKGLAPLVAKFIGSDAANASSSSLAESRSVFAHTAVVHTTLAGGIALKITLTPKFLARPLNIALIEPFLGAVNKRASAPASPLFLQDVDSVTVDGVSVDANEVAGTLLPRDAHRVELTLKERSA